MVLPAPGARRALAAAPAQASLLRTSLRFRLMLYVGFVTCLPSAHLQFFSSICQLLCLALPYILVLSSSNSSPRYSRTLYPSHPCSAIPTLNKWRISMPPLPHACASESCKLSCRSLPSLCYQRRCTIANRSLLISPNDRTHAERWWNSLIPTNEGGQILRNPRGIARTVKTGS